MPARNHLQLVNSTTDESLIVRAQSGEADAFSSLVSRHMTGVHRFCVKMAGGAIGDELMQETFTRLWQARADYRPTMPFVNYLYSIAANICRTHHRSLNRRLRLLESVTNEFESAQPNLSHRLEQQQELTRITEALAHLPEAQREAVVLRFCESLDSEALGQALGCNASTARSRVFFGLKRLRELLGDAP